jgi:hypothetical protein
MTAAPVRIAGSSARAGQFSPRVPALGPQIGHWRGKARSTGDVFPAGARFQARNRALAGKTAASAGTS